MTEVQRFSVGVEGVDPNGNLVRYSDYARLQQQVQQLAAQNTAAMDIVGRLIGQYSCAGYHAVQNSNNPAQSLLYDAMQVEKLEATDAWLNEVRAQAIPDGYALVPAEIHLLPSDIEGICSQCGDGGHMFGDFTDGLLWVGEVQNDDGTITHGLHITTEDYPEEGAVTLQSFANPLRAREVKTNG